MMVTWLDVLVVTAVVFALPLLLLILDAWMVQAEMWWDRRRGRRW